MKRTKRNSAKIILSLFILFSTSDVFAKVTGLINWQENGVNVILPKIDSKDPKTIPQLYKTALEKFQPYKEFRPFFGEATSIADQFEMGKISNFPEKTPSSSISEERVPFAIFANTPSLMNQKSKPYQNFKKSFGSAGASIYMVAFGVDALLTDKEDLKTYFELISKQFPALLSPGGDDFDPEVYGEKNKSAVDINRTRDEAEIQLIQTFINSGYGIFYGVCRGHQGYAIAMGGTLVQDLPEKLTPTIHRPIKHVNGTFSSAWHSITLTGKDNALFQAVQKESFLVNSRHHESVKSLPLEKGKAIAFADGTVIEAIEKKDAQGMLKVLTFQFHPEDMNTPESEKLIKWLVDQARQGFRPPLEIESPKIAKK
jgi:putative glutamine amidotransferase